MYIDPPKSIFRRIYNFIKWRIIFRNRKWKYYEMPGIHIGNINGIKINKEN